MIGDSERDIAAARAVGGRPMLVLTGNGRATKNALQLSGDLPETFPDLAAAVAVLVDESAQRREQLR